jgi:hypothetical protein
MSRRSRSKLRDETGNRHQAARAKRLTAAEFRMTLLEGPAGGPG